MILAQLSLIHSLLGERVYENAKPRFYPRVCVIPGQVHLAVRHLPVPVLPGIYPFPLSACCTNLLQGKTYPEPSLPAAAQVLGFDSSLLPAFTQHRHPALFPARVIPRLCTRGKWTTPLGSTTRYTLTWFLRK